MRQQVWLVALALGALAGLPPNAAAQGVRIRGVTTVRFLELRPFIDDSVAFGTTLPGAVDYRQLSDGRVVRCVEGDEFCRFKRAGSVANAVPLVQDLQMTAWGLGRGVSLRADIRLRSAMGSQPALWPRAEDAFDALLAYVELDRSRYTARAGRQYITSGLGFYNFDGASIAYRPNRRITVEGFGGWSLAQALNEQVTTGEIGAVDELPPDRNAYLVGAQLRLKPTDRSAVSAFYQREVRDNRSALYSERVALDGTWRLGRAGLDGSLQRDLSTSEFNELCARVRLPPIARTVVSLEARHFSPFFQLWTIWGAFAPAGFDEARVQASWRNAAQSLSIDVHGARRRWSDTEAGLEFDALRSDGWRVGGNVTWQAASNWHTNAGYSADVGFGAARSEGDLGVHWTRGRAFLGATASAFQSIFELRIGTGRVLGFGVDAGWLLNPDVRVVADVSAYQQLARNGAPSTDWTQRRATARFEWMLGADPGASAVSAANRKADARVRGEAELARLALSRGRLPASLGAPEIPP